MDRIHIFCAEDQPATRYVDNNLTEPIVFENSERRSLRCRECGRQRWAKNLIVHVYYDDTRFFCREGHEWDGRRRRFVTRQR